METASSFFSSKGAQFGPYAATATYSPNDIAPIAAEINII